MNIEFKCIYCGELEVSCCVHNKDDIEYHCLVCRRKYHHNLVLEYRKMSAPQKMWFRLTNLLK